MKSEAGPPHAVDFCNIPHGTGVKITFVARPLLMPVEQKLCRCKHVYSWVERVFIVTH
jgi:hypothetical protein